jgi:subtilase family serine protease
MAEVLYRIVRGRLAIILPCALILMAGSILMPSQAYAQAGNTQIPGCVLPFSPELAATEQPLTPQDLNETLDFEVSLRMPNFQELNQILASGGHVSEAEMQEDYLPTQAQYSNVLNWITAEGFTINMTDQNRIGLFAVGTVAQIEAAFDVKMVDVTSDGTEYQATDENPSVPQDMAGYILGISGLQPYQHFNATPITGAPLQGSITAVSPVPTGTASVADFAASPVPEPGTWALAAGALGLLGGIKRLRRSRTA